RRWNRVAPNDGRGQERRIAYFGDAVVRRHFDQPGTDDITAVETCADRRYLNHVVVDVARTVDRQRRSRESVPIDSVEWIDARHDAAIGQIKLKDGPAGARIVHEPVGQRRVVDRFPEITLRSRGHPVRIERPYPNELAALPLESVLMPALRAIGR